MSTAPVDTSATADTGSLDTAAAAFEALLGPEPAPKPPKKTPEATAEADEAEALEADASDEDAEDDGDTEAEEVDEEAEDDGSDEEADADAEDGEQLELPLDALVTVKVGGKEEQIPLKEAIAGYQRQADYSRKTGELAEHRKAFQSEVQAVRQERAQYATLLSALEQQALAGATEAPDWERLKAEDPLEYAIKREEYREAQERHGAIQAERQRLFHLQAAEQQEQVRTAVQQEASKLLEALPVAKDPQKWQATQGKLREYGKKLGYSDQELSAAYDHRAVVALYKAMQYDALMAKKAAPVEQRKNTIPARTVQTVKTVPAGSANRPPRRVTEAQRAHKRLSQTGSVKDAASVFEQLL